MYVWISMYALTPLKNKITYLHLLEFIQVKWQ